MHKRSRITIGGVLLGVGLGGFVDGIVLHQVLQWHNMLSSHGDYPTDTVAGLQANVVADGLFHVFTWIATVAGLALVWSATRRGRQPWSNRGFLGLLLAGWGAFNVVEGVINHHLLGLHDVREDVAGTAQLAWNLGFLAFGALLVVAGYALARDELRPGRGGARG